MAATKASVLRAAPDGTDVPVRQALVAAMVRCIAERHSLRISLEEVGRTAGVSRSTVYRAFANRDDLLEAVLVSRLDAALARIVAGLEEPGRAVVSLPQIIIRSLGLIHGDPVNEVLVGTDATGSAALILGSDPVTDTSHAHVGPLLRRWQDSGQIHADLDLRETTRYIDAFANLMTRPPLAALDTDGQRRHIEVYLLRALLTEQGRS